MVLCYFRRFLLCIVQILSILFSNQIHVQSETKMSQLYVVMIYSIALHVQLRTTLISWHILFILLVVVSELQFCWASKLICIDKRIKLTWQHANVAQTFTIECRLPPSFDIAGFYWIYLLCGYCIRGKLFVLTEKLAQFACTAWTLYSCKINENKWSGLKCTACCKPTQYFCEWMKNSTANLWMREREETKWSRQ